MSTGSNVTTPLDAEQYSRLCSFVLGDLTDVERTQMRRELLANPALRREGEKLAAVLAASRSVGVPPTQRASPPARARRWKAVVAMAAAVLVSAAALGWRTGERPQARDSLATCDDAIDSLRLSVCTNVHIYQEPAAGDPASPATHEDFDLALPYFAEAYANPSRPQSKQLAPLLGPRSFDGLTGLVGGSVPFEPAEVNTPAPVAASGEPVASDPVPWKSAEVEVVAAETASTDEGSFVIDDDYSLGRRPYRSCRVEVDG